MGATILIADDDHLHLKCLTHHLEKAGYSVIQATDSFHALRLASQLKPSLIILDINMPAGDGFSVKERLDKPGPHRQHTGDLPDRRAFGSGRRTRCGVRSVRFAP